MHTLLEAVALVVLAVIVFLQTWSASIIPLLAVPVSVARVHHGRAARGCHPWPRRGAFLEFQDRCVWATLLASILRVRYRGRNGGRSNRAAFPGGDA
ncbi:MAG TPA: efflux RND transporter permease subunit [Hyphomicrobiaceae bacterium]|nr:efflux RND transporter permease subunit [Hyphomicrobiaceae bacterium]